VPKLLVGEMTTGMCQANIKIVLLFKSTLQQAANESF
jgi:hypothetical protein